jgi:hypothetical protein
MSILAWDLTCRFAVAIAANVGQRKAQEGWRNETIRQTLDNASSE